MLRKKKSNVKNFQKTRNNRLAISSKSAGKKYLDKFLPSIANQLRKECK